VNLVKYYGRWRVVDGVSVRVEAGEVVGLLGPNGAGKTTTFHMIVGVHLPESGTIRLLGKDITRLPMYQRARLGTGYLAQEPSVFRKLTVRENILAVLEMLPIPKADRAARLEELLHDLEITHLANRRGMTLSGGERRRTEIARALATRPALLLLDEPFVGIDPKTVSEIQKIVFRLKERGLGILITDHAVRETLQATNLAYIMFEGKIILSGSAEELAGDPVARKLYLGEEFRL
jgi:lipopolysaccharide export system ATP-binding protein